MYADFHSQHFSFDFKIFMMNKVPTSFSSCEPICLFLFSILHVSSLIYFCQVMLIFLTETTNFIMCGYNTIYLAYIVIPFSFSVPNSVKLVVHLKLFYLLLSQNFYFTCFQTTCISCD